jgi:hypothetical protein
MIENEGVILENIYLKKTYLVHKVQTKRGDQSIVDLQNYLRVEL